MTPARLPHSDTPGSTLGCQLPRAYRRLLRPSSALDAKASTMCPSQLLPHTTNPTPHTRHTHKPPTEKKKLRTGPLRHPTHAAGRQCTQHTTKMLASTIQISNNNPTPTRSSASANHPAVRAPPGNQKSLEVSVPKPQTPQGRAHTRGRRLILQNPNSVSPAPGSPRQDPAPAPHGSSRHRPDPGQRCR